VGDRYAAETVATRDVALIDRTPTASSWRGVQPGERVVTPA
jgi:hypothetical protein